MAHFALLNEDNIVQQVVVVDDSFLIDPDTGEEVEANGIEYLIGLGVNDGTWIQTSYSGRFRHRFAGIGMVYLPDLDVFLWPKPYPSWVLNTTTYEWESPVPRPDEPYPFLWDEENLKWILDLPTPDEIDDEELKELSQSIYDFFSSGNTN